MEYNELKTWNENQNGSVCLYITLRVTITNLSNIRKRLSINNHFKIKIDVKFTKGQIWDASIAKNVPKGINLLCTKFHAYITKWTIVAKNCTNLPNYKGYKVKISQTSHIYSVFNFISID